LTPAERAARAVFEVFESGDLERVRDLVTDDFVDHGAPPGLASPGPDGYLAVLRYVTGVLQIRYEVHDVVADGDKVAIRATAHGVHRTDLLGVPATGRPYAMPTMHLYRARATASPSTGASATSSACWSSWPHRPRPPAPPR
jgi:predicted ester cyclase